MYHKIRRLGYTKFMRELCPVGSWTHGTFLSVLCWHRICRSSLDLRDVFRWSGFFIGTDPLPWMRRIFPGCYFYNMFRRALCSRAEQDSSVQRPLEVNLAGFPAIISEKMKNNFQFESILKNANGDNKAFPKLGSILMLPNRKNL